MRNKVLDLTETKSDRQSGTERRRSGSSGTKNDRATGQEASRSRRSDPERVDSVSGDQAGVAGGAIDSKVTGRGGNG